MNRDAFADRASLADAAVAFVSVERVILRQIADDGVGVDAAILADFGVSQNRRECLDPASCPDAHGAVDDGVRPDDGGGMNRGQWIDDGGGVCSDGCGFPKAPRACDEERIGGVVGREKRLRSIRSGESSAKSRFMSIANRTSEQRAT
jgi:hypothetical protein